MYSFSQTQSDRLNWEDLQNSIIRLQKMTMYKVKSCAKEGKTTEELVTDLYTVIDHITGNHQHCDVNCPKQGVVLNHYPEEVVRDLKNICREKMVKYVSSLRKGISNNIVEQFHNVIAMTVGGKRENFSLRDGYKHRYTTGVVHHNSGDASVAYVERVLKRKPNTLLEKISEKRLNTNLKRKNTEPTLRTSAKRMKKVENSNNSKHYGPKCNAPDASEAQLITWKKELMETLTEDQENSEAVQIETCTDKAILESKLRRVLSPDCYGPICKSRKTVS